jgi:hypothetical protein
MSTSAFGRLTRVTDLFVEGSELDLGQDETGTPVVVWVKKLNSFEDSEARKDGMAARAARILALKAEDNPDHVNLLDQIERQGDDWLRDQVVDSTYEEDYLRAVDDVDSDPEWYPRLDELRRMDVILSEGGVPEGDPRWAELTKANEEYVAAIGKALSERQGARREEVERLPREELVDRFTEAWRERKAADDWIEAKQITEVFFALRDCQATPFDEGKWDHKTCNHGRKLLESREQVRDLPQEMLQKVVAKIRMITFTEREAGNSDAPMTSSGSSEPQSEPGA